ncbi:MAG: DoxX family protein, partial [Burkholderiales bacterium]
FCGKCITHNTQEIYRTCAATTPQICYDDPHSMGYSIEQGGRMSKLDTLHAEWAPRMLSILRIVTAFLFIQHGSMKLLGFPSSTGFAELKLFSLIGFAGVLELFGGFLVLFGLFTRPVAFILSGEMAFAYFMAHAPHGFFPVVNRGELAVLYCFVFLYLAVAGGGVWSFDQIRRRRIKI